MADEQSLVKAGTQSLVPTYLTEVDLSGPTGLEAITAKDMKMPRLAIAQTTSNHARLMDEDSPEYIPGLKVGMFFDTVNKVVFGKGPLIVTPLVAKKHRRLFSSRDEGSKTLCISDNGIDGGRLAKLCDLCPKSKFGWDKKKNSSTRPECTLFWSYLILIHTDENSFYPISLSLKSKMISAAEELNTFMRGRRIAGKQAPAYLGIYNVSTFYDTSSTAGSFYNLKFRNAEWVPEKLVANVQALFKDYGPKIDAIAQEHAESDDEPIDGEIIGGDDDDVPF
jgi:hypothetical protein